MAQRRLLKRGTALLTWTFLLIVVPLAIYAVSVFDQRVHVRANNLRTLSKAADTTAELFQTLLRNVRNLDGKCDKRSVDEFLKRQPRLARVDDYSQCKKPLKVKRSADLRVTADGVEVWSTQYESTKDEDQKDYLKFTVRLDDVLAEIPFGDVLDLLLIADDAGKVIEQRRPKGRADIGLKLASLSGLPLVDGGATLASADLQRSSTMRTVRIAGADYELLCQPLNVGFVLANNIEKKSSSDANKLSLSNDSPAQASGVQRQFVMCGLVASQSGLEQALRVRPFLALFLFATIIFAFLSWPMLKLVLMSERDRLQFSDLCFLLIGTWTALMLATILVLSLGVHQQLRARSARSLDDLAARIETNLRGEVDELTVRLADWDKSLAGLPGSVGLKGLPDISDFYGEVKATFPDTADSERLGAAFDWKSWRPPVKRDFFIRAFWADCNDKGNQVFKVTLAKTNTTRLSLEDREYFQAVRQDRLWAARLGPAAGPKEGKDIRRFVQSVRSLTTGEFGTVVSLESTIGPPRGACAAMAAIEAKLVATTHPVLSPGVGFAIIDENGAVVLHSDERRAGFENLYDEMDDGRRLRAIVLSGQADVFATTYLDRPHQVFVRPLTELPWFVVTFADTEMITTTSLEIIGHAFVLVVVELVIFILVMGLYWIIKGSEIPRWFWPKAHRPEWSARIYVPALVAFVFAGWLVDGDLLVAVAILIPLVAVTALYLVYCRGGARGVATVGGSHLGQVRANIASSYALWLVVAIIPAGLFFKLAAEGESRLLMRYESEYLSEQLARRTCAIEDYYEDVDLSGLCEGKDCYPPKYPPERLENARDLYPSTLFAPNPGELRGAKRPRWFVGSTDDPLDAGRVRVSVEKSASVTGRAVSERPDTWRLFAWLKPLYNDTTVSSRYLGTSSPKELLGRGVEWFNSRNGATEIYGASPLACGTQVTIASGPPVVLGASFLAWTIPLGIALLVALFFWARYCARRIFFGELEDPTSPDLRELTAILRATPAGSGCWIIALATTPHDLSTLLAAPMTGNGDDSFRRVAASAYHTGQVQRAELLDKLEAFAASGDNVLIVSTEDPQGLLSPARASDETGSASETQASPNDLRGKSADRPRSDGDQSRWRRLLSRARFAIIGEQRPTVSRDSTSFWRRGLDRVVTQSWLDAELEVLLDPLDLRPELLPRLVGSTRRQALDRIVDHAAAYYLSLWEACSEAEKLVLVQLAFENVVNPKQSIVIRRLLERGLLLRDPVLRLFNRSFALFITRVYDPGEVSEWERHTTGFSWTETRWILVGLLVIGSLFLWATQRELFNSGIMFLSAAAVGLPAVLKLLASAQKSP